MSLALPSLGSSSGGYLASRSLRVTNEAMARDVDFINVLASAKNKKEPRPEKCFSMSSLGGSSIGGASTSSFKLAQGLGRNPTPAPSGRRTLDPLQTETASEELRAKRRVFKLRNELAHSRSTAATMRWHASNMSSGDEVRSETKRLQGAHLHNSVAYVPPATDEEVGKVATTLMRKLAQSQPEPSERGWFKLFKMFDENGDGHISYEELIEMIRNKIKVPKEVISETQIQAVWHSIDLDGNGWIDAGEFGRFFRLGEKPERVRRQKKSADDLARAYVPAEYREPTLAEMNIERAMKNTSRLGEEEKQLQLALRRSAASLPSSASVRSLPPLR